MTSLARLVATGFGAGRLPLAPGSWGSLLAVAVAWGLWRWQGPWAVLAASAVAAAAGYWALRACGDWASGDPPEVVIDEIAGQMIACWPAALMALDPARGWAAWAGSFAAFRFFDILKPGPVRAAERLGGAAGVMADDLVAGTASAACVAFAIFALTRGLD